MSVRPSRPSVKRVNFAEITQSKSHYEPFKVIHGHQF